MEACRALEYVAIRSELVHDRSEARSEFEADSIRTLVRVLHTRSSGSAANGNTPGPNNFNSGGVGSGVGTGAAGQQFSAATVQEAANILTAIVAAAAAPATAAAGVQGSAASTSVTKPQGSGQAARTGSTEALSSAATPTAPDSTQGSASFVGLSENPLANLAFMQPLAGDFAAAGQEAAARVTLREGVAGGNSRPAVSDAGQLVVDHGRGIATNAALQGGTQLSSAHWTRLAGQYASAFKSVAKAVGEGPWRAVKVQLAWLLFLLAAKSPANRELITKLERTILSPLAQQLANAERFYSSAVAAAALAETEDQAVTPLPISTLANERSLPLQSSGSSSKPLGTNSWPTNPSLNQGPVGAYGAAAGAPLAVSTALPASTVAGVMSSMGAGTVGGSVPGAYQPGPAVLPGSSTPGGVLPPGIALGSQLSPLTPAKTSDDEDDLAMIRQEVAMLSALGTPRN